MDSPATDLLALALSRPATLGSGRLICIDGPAGGGKSTLAAAVARLAPATLIAMDDLYDGWDGLPRLADQLDTLLLPLAAGNAGSYRRYDWSRGAYAETVTVAPCPLLVLEGVGSGMAAYADLHTALAWVDAPTDLRRERALARDGEAFAQHWDAWAAAERAHFERDLTRERADVRVTTQR